MSWTNIFYPGNPGRRDEAVSHITEFRVYMDFNFDSTNDLIDILNEEANPSTPFSKIYVNSDGTVKDNCQMLLDKMDEIMVFVDKMNEELAQKLEPAAYRQLSAPDMTIADRIAVAKTAITAGLAVAFSAAAIAVGFMIKFGLILSKMVTAIGIVKTCAVSTVVLGVLWLGVDMIVSAITGAVERDKLEDTIAELEEALDVFKPAAKEYTMAIISVQMALKM